MKFIQMTGKYGRFKYAMVDDEDFEELIKHKWRLTKDGYAVTNIGGKREVGMHRVIMNPSDDMLVDHINGDRLDLRKENLRICSHKGNNQNRAPTNRVKKTKSQHKGVQWRPISAKWQACIMVERKREVIGYFSTDVLAAHAYDAKAIEYFGEFARLNFPEYLYDGYVVKSEVKKKMKTSKYIGVVKGGKNTWKVHITERGKYMYSKHGFLLEDDAAKHYNEYVINNNLSCKLNTL